jgi:hypothetical protein
MKKTNADQVRSQFIPHQNYQDALRHLSPDQLRDSLHHLNTLQAALEQNISDYALDLTHDLLDDETPQIVRTFWFSKGIREYYLCVDGTGLIRAVEDKMPNRLFDQIMSTMDLFYT